MLVSFSVSNFRSFGQEETLNMVASNKLPDHPTHRLPIGDTGKHVLRMRSDLRRQCRRQVESGPSDERGPAIDPVKRRAARNDRSFPLRSRKAPQPSSFEFRFLLGDQVFIYGFDVTTAQIFGEWLAVLKDGDELTIFARDREGVARIEGKAERFFPDDTTLFKTLGLLSPLPLTTNQLFLEPRCSSRQILGYNTKRCCSLAH